MLSSQKKDFVELLTSTFRLFNKEISLSSVSIWWSVLEEYDFELVSKAFSVYIKTNKFPPVPASVLELLPCHLGHPSPEEAWNRLPKTEEEGGYMSNEMAHAMGAAWSSIERGDLVAARMAFLESYRAVVNESRMQSRKPNFFYSGPTKGNKDARGDVLRLKTDEAKQLGWIDDKRADRLLLENKFLKLEHLSDSPASNEQAKENIKRIREMIKGLH